MNAKKLILGAFALLGLAACQTNTEEATPAVKLVSDAAVTADQAGGSYTITFTSAASWEVRGLDDCDWIAVDKVSGNGSSAEQTLTVDVTPNEGADREATLTIYSSPLAKKSVTISQSGAKGDGIDSKTVAEVIAEADATKTYRLTGTVSGFSSTYCSFDLTDATGSIYVYSVTSDSKTQYASVIKNGGTVTITGTYKYYETKSQHEIVDATIESYTAPEGGDPDKAADATVAEFIAKADVVNYYRLTGTISGVNNTYGSFTLTDATGSVYVYSLASDSKTEWASKLANGGKVVIRAQYSLYGTTVEAINAIIDSYEAGTVEKTTIEGLVVAVTSKGFLVQTSSDIKYIYDADITPSVKIGDSVKVEAEETTYNGIKEYENYTVTTVSTGNAVTYPTATDLNGAALDSYTTAFGYVKFSGVLSISGSYYNITVTNATAKGSILNPVGVDASLSGAVVEVEGYYLYTSGSTTKYVNIVATKLSKSDDQSGVVTYPEGSIILTFPMTDQQAVSSYTSSFTGKSGDYTFTFNGYNNNNNSSSWTFIKCGSKSAATEPTIVSPALAKAIESVVITFDTVSKDPDAAKVIVADDADFKTNATEVAFTPKSGTTVTVPVNAAAGKFYKIYMNCAKGSANGYVVISKIVFAAAK